MIGHFLVIHDRRFKIALFSLKVSDAQNVS
jgi:hypothetical protein